MLFNLRKAVCLSVPIWFTVCKADGLPFGISERAKDTRAGSIVASAKPRLPDFLERCANPLSLPQPCGSALLCAFHFCLLFSFFFFLLSTLCLRTSCTVYAFWHSNSLCSRPRKFTVGMHGREIAKSSSPFLLFFFFFFLFFSFSFLL